MGSISPTDLGAYTKEENDALAHREAKNDAINNYNDSAGELKKPDLPPVEATQDTPADPDQVADEQVEEKAGDTLGTKTEESEEEKKPDLT